LTELTKEAYAKCAELPWSDTCERAFREVNTDLTTAPVLAVPDCTKPFELVCDASGFGLGAVLLQEGRPVAFESRKLTSAELNYITTEAELLAVVHALKIWRCYLEGTKFVVVTDHCPNTFFQTQPMLSRRQARWSEFLQQFDFRWEYRPGRTNVADPLSRRPDSNTTPVLMLLSRKHNSIDPTHSSSGSPARTLRCPLCPDGMRSNFT